MKKTIIIIGSAAVLSVAWYLLSPLWNVIELDERSPLSPEEQAALDDAMEEGNDVVMEKDEPMPAQVTLLSEAPFVAKAHDVAGKALLIEENGKKIVRFEEFDTINGPDLHIYLSADLTGKDYVDLGSIKATKGNANYDIPEGTDTDTYRHVLVWCEPFRVLFSSASF